MLFVPADSERKIAKGLAAGADAVILDLEDSVAAARKGAARDTVAGLLGGDTGASAVFVRVNPFDSGLALADLAAVVRPGLDGIMLPKAGSATDVVRLGHCLDALESRAGMTLGSVQVVVVATETPAALFALGSYAPAHPRLAALTWGAEDLSAAVGATDNKDADGGWTAPYQFARTQCLFAAAAAVVAPVDTLYADFRDTAGLEVDSRRARRDGFVGRLAIHPDQVPVINAAFAPSLPELAWARRIVDAFAAAPEAGTLGIDGKMVDRPHLIAAQRTLASA